MSPKEMTVWDLRLRLDELLKGGTIRLTDPLRIDFNDGEGVMDRVISVEMEDSGDGQDRWRVLVICCQGRL